MPDTFCPLRGERCNTECEWMSDSGFCVAQHIAVNMERIADALEEIVTGPSWEEELLQ
jgi:hypothetical protein